MPLLILNKKGTMDNRGNLGTKKGLLSYLQPGCQGCDEEDTKRQILRSRLKK